MADGTVDELSEIVNERFVRFRVDGCARVGCRMAISQGDIVQHYLLGSYACYYQGVSMIPMRWTIIRI